MASNLTPSVARRDLRTLWLPVSLGVTRKAAKVDRDYLLGDTAASIPEVGRCGPRLDGFVPGGVLACIFDTDGRLAQRFDGIEFLRHIYPDADDAKLAELAGLKLQEFGEEGDAWKKLRPMNKGWLTAYIDRYAKKS